jgi:hypothetical protein
MATINITVQSLLNTAVYDLQIVDTAGTIGDLKTAMVTNFSYSADWFDLVFNNQVLNTAQTIGSYGIVEGSQLRTHNKIARLATRELRQEAKLALAALDRAASSNTRSEYDITELPTYYVNDTVTDNPNSTGLIEGRPWVSGSLSFDGSNYLSVAGGAGTAMGTGDFTWECWVYPTSSSDYQAFIDTRTSPLTGGDTTGFYFGTNNNTLNPMYYTNGLQLASSVAMTLNAWNHVALTRASGTVTLWVNGASGGTKSDTTNLAEQRVFVGGTSQGVSTGLLLTGNISNLRIVKGIALYTSAFTVPTQALTAIAGTQLLVNVTNNIASLKDISTNNFAIANTGGVATSTANPF